MQIHKGMESCPIRSAMSGVIGFGLGGAFGMFMASVRFTRPPGARAQSPTGRDH